MDPERLLAVLKLPPGATEFIERTSIILQRLGPNPYFPNPTPTMAILQADLTALRNAQSLKGNGKAATKARNVAMKTMKRDLQQLLSYVQGVCDANPLEAAAILASIAMYAKAFSAHDVPDLQVRQGPVTGSAVGRVKSRGPRATYWWQTSTDQKSWSTGAPTRKATESFANLTPGTTYYFRYQVLTAAGMSDWSQIISFMVK
jgi:hypothetical protein